MLRKCQQLFLEELHGCEGEERRRRLAEGYLVFEGRGVYMCAVLKCKTGDDTSRNGSAQGRGQRYKKRVRYTGEWDWEPHRGMEPFSCLPNREFGKRKGGYGSICWGRSGGSYWPALFLYLLRVRGGKCAVRDRRIMKVWNGW